MAQTAADRNAAFRQAGRHTAFVRSLRWLLPLAAVITLASYGYFMRTSIKIGWGGKTIEASSVIVSREALVAVDPRYAGFDKQGGSFEVKAKTAEQDLKQRGIVRLKTINGHIIDPNRVRTDIAAVRGIFDTTSNVLELFERIDVRSQNGMTADLTRATILTKEHRIVSEEPVVVRMPTGTVRGKSMVIEQRRKHVTFRGDVVAHLVPQPKAGTPPPASPDMRGGQDAADKARAEQPIDVTSHELAIDDAKKTARFTGNVVARQGDQVLEAPELEIAYDGQPTSAAPAVATATAQSPQGRLRSLVARNNVVLTRGLERATGSEMAFDAVNDRATLLGPVVIEAGPDRGATADRADMDNKSDVMQLTGNVVVTQQKNVLKGRLLVANRKGGTVQLTSPAMVGLPKGQISARLYQNESEDAAKKQPAGAAAAQPKSGMPGVNFKSDPSQPVDIDADRLDVDDKKKTAIFTGRVRAVQGEYTIVTEQLVATYAGEAGLTLTPTAPHAQAKAAPGQPKPTAQLQSIVSPSRARIITKDGQRAEGDTVSFDPKANTARFSGNVVLSQGKMITNGNCAVLDMNTGSMKLIDACGFSTATQQKAGPSATSPSAAPRPTGTARAQALFYPGEMQDTQREKTKAAAAAKSAPGQPTAAASTTAPAATTSPAPPPAPVPAQRAPSRSAPGGSVGDVFNN